MERSRPVFNFLMFFKKKKGSEGQKKEERTKAYLELKARQKPAGAGEQQQEPVHRELVDQDEHAHQDRLQILLLFVVMVLGE